MSHYNQQQAPPQAYTPPPEAYPPAYVVPPPAGYPTNDASGNPQQVPVETRSRGDDGFWKGCCAALCCCCALDICF